MPPLYKNTAAAFAKGGDNEEHLEVSLNCLRIHLIPLAKI